MPQARLLVDLPDGPWIADVSRDFPDAGFRVLTAVPDESAGFALIRLTARDVDDVLAAMRDHEALAKVSVMAGRRGRDRSDRDERPAASGRREALGAPDRDAAGHRERRGGGRRHRRTRARRGARKAVRRDGAGVRTRSRPPARRSGPAADGPPAGAPAHGRGVGVLRRAAPVHPDGSRRPRRNREVDVQRDAPAGRTDRGARVRRRPPDPLDEEVDAAGDSASDGGDAASETDAESAPNRPTYHS